jgi:phosphonate transport system substrate-binding protein
MLLDRNKISHFDTQSTTTKPAMAGISSQNADNSTEPRHLLSPHLFSHSISLSLINQINFMTNTPCHQKGSKPLTPIVASSLLVLLSLSGGCSSSVSNSSNAASASRGSDPETLVVALLPDHNNSTLLKKNQRLKEYLAKKLNKRVDLFISTSYSSMVTASNQDRFDLAYFGPVSYVLAETKGNIEPFASLQKNGKTTSRAVVVGNTSQGINSIADIKGKLMAYGDPGSTNSHLIPKSVLADAGLRPHQDYKEVFLGNFEAVALAVQSGKVQAGGLSQSTYNSLVANKTIDPNKVKLLATSDPFPQHAWTMRSNLSPELKTKIRSAFLDLKDPKVMEPFKADGFGAITAQDYDSVRKRASLIGLELTVSGK